MSHQFHFQNSPKAQFLFQLSNFNFNSHFRTQEHNDDDSQSALLRRSPSLHYLTEKRRIVKTFSSILITKMYLQKERMEKM